MAAACLTSPYCCAPLAADGMYGPTGANAKPHRRWLRPRMAGGTHMDRGGCTRRVAPSDRADCRCPSATRPDGTATWQRPPRTTYPALGALRKPIRFGHTWAAIRTLT